MGLELHCAAKRGDLEKMNALLSSKTIQIDKRFNLILILEILINQNKKRKRSGKNKLKERKQNRK